MIHPLLRLIATRPHLLADHAEAYAELLGEELGQTMTVWKRRALLNAIALSMGAVCIVLGGVAVMLWAAVPAGSLQAPWALIAAPAVPGLVAIWCGYAGTRKAEQAFVDLRKQMAADLMLLREVGAA